MHSEQKTQTIDADVEPIEVMQRIVHSLARIYHDTNNPLAIVSGNAQYLLELARAMDLDEDLVQPMRDVEEASERVAKGLREIAWLRDELQEYLAGNVLEGPS